MTEQYEYRCLNGLCGRKQWRERDAKKCFSCRWGDLEATGREHRTEKDEAER